jgi:DNA-binding transcriptional regulator YhcF (GntR family)
VTAEPALRLDLSSAVPPYEQVRQQLADLITHGVLAAGEKLPPVRQLAADLGLAKGTVARAYQELESAGLVVTRRAAGTQVAVTTPRSPAARAAALAQRTQAFVQAARLLGVTDADIREAVAQATTAPVLPGGSGVDRRGGLISRRPTPS